MKQVDYYIPYKMELLLNKYMKSVVLGFLTIFFVSASSSTMSAQQSIWKTLSKITYQQEYNELFGFKVDIPVFSEPIIKLEDTVIEVKGYIIPIEGYKSHKEFMFSAFPYNMCFFCGGAGPETVMEVSASEPIEYSAEQVIIKGKLKLNADDINRMMYILEDVTLVKE